MDEQRELLAELRKKHGTVAGFNVPGHGLLVVGKAQSEKAYQICVNAMHGKQGADVAVAQKQFVLNCVKYPEDKQSVRSMLAEFPALATLAFNRAYDLNGGAIEELGND